MLHYVGKRRVTITARQFHLCRSLSRIKNPPDNSPTLNENDQWLNHLNTNPTSTTVTSFKDPYRMYTPAKQIGYKIVDAKGKYGTDITISSALANFSSLNYLKPLSNKHHHHRRQEYRESNFQDTKIIHCKSGKGGDGCISFFRDANRRVGPPDGGDGGQGGSIHIQTVAGLNSLTKLSSLYVAPDGHPGQADQLDGARGKDILIKVPIGSTIRWCMNPKEVRTKLMGLGKISGGEDTRPLKRILEEQEILLDCIKSGISLSPSIRLSRDIGDPFEVAKTWLFKDKTMEYHLEKQWFKDFNQKMKQYDRSLIFEEKAKDVFPLYGLDLDKHTTAPIKLLDGGKGGLGNMHFLTSMIRNPRFAKHGRPGLESWFLIELKIIADIGLIGFPNAGKSTILNKISNARPRIGHWEFTTLTPSIGTVSVGTPYNDTSFTVADIPGIVKGAHLDRGMGLEFLKHIERSKCWCFVVSLGNENPLQDFLTLIEEVGGINCVKEKEVLVVANKADLTGSPITIARYEGLRHYCEEHNWEIVPISALENQNIDLLIHKMKDCLSPM